MSINVYKDLDLHAVLTTEI